MIFARAPKVVESCSVRTQKNVLVGGADFL